MPEQRDSRSRVLPSEGGYELPTADNISYWGLHMTPGTADAWIEATRQAHAVPAIEATKQAREKTKQVESESWRIHGPYICTTICVVLGGAAIVYFEMSTIKVIGLVLLVGILAGPQSIEKIVVAFRKLGGS